jgi:membrane peptidoglycan carboxypeptidase
MVSPESNAPPTKMGAFMQFVAVSAVAGIVAAGLAIPGVGVATASANSAVEIFDSLPATLEIKDLGEKSTMLAADGSELAEFYWQNRQEVPLDKISKDMQNATIAVEDYRYFEHGGVDIEGIARAAVHNMVSSTTQGGSTLTQQYVKNVLAENAHAEDNSEGVAAAKESDGTAGYARKLREAKLAVAVEKKYDKKEILNRYMNINNYSGSPNVYGVEAAAYRYWGIHAKDLNIQQSAMLAGIVQNPSAFNPQRFPDQVLKRRNTVLGQMLKYDHITQKEYDKAVKTDLDLDLHETPNGCSAAKSKAEFFCNYVQNVIMNDDTFGDTADERLAFLQRGGLKIKTSLNPDIQKIADKEIKKRVPVGDPSGAGHALVTIEPGTGEVIAMAENREYTVGEVKKKDKNKKTSINYTVDKKHNGGGGFQVGSTWKPFVLTAWLKEGKSLNTTVNATKRNFPASSWKYEGCPNMGGDWDPNNAGDGEGKGSMTALEATKKSVNTGYAAMGNQLNMCGHHGYRDGPRHPLWQRRSARLQGQVRLHPSPVTVVDPRYDGDHPDRHGRGVRDLRERGRILRTEADHRDQGPQRREARPARRRLQASARQGSGQGRRLRADSDVQRRYDELVEDRSAGRRQDRYDELRGRSHLAARLHQNPVHSSVDR